MGECALGCVGVAQAPWLLMIETDYVWMRPLQAPPAQDPASRGAAFPFGYITPAAPGLEGVMRKMYPPEMGPTSDIPGTGPAPVMLRFAEWLQVGNRCCSILLVKTVIRIWCYTSEGILRALLGPGEHPDLQQIHLTSGLFV